MKLTDPRHPWQRLVAVARNAESSLDDSAPYGFATRVSAMAFAQVRPQTSLFELFAPRALGIACLLMLASLAVNYSTLTSGSDLDTSMMEGQPAVAILFEGS